MNVSQLELLLNTLSSSGTSFILGAGASAPDVPTLRQIPGVVAKHVDRIATWPVGPIPDSPLRRLIGPLIDAAKATSSIAEWKAAAVTSATIAAMLENTISAAHFTRLPQYEVFGLLPLSSTVVSFNWDGLARTRLSQPVVLHPHGAVKSRSVFDLPLDDLLLNSQLEDNADYRDWLLPGLVMPGEEDASDLEDLRNHVLQIWIEARAIVVIGYSFGFGQRGDYDRIWRDVFIEAMRRNPIAPIHIIDPDGHRIRGEIENAISRAVNLHSWPFRWNTLAVAILRTVRRLELRRPPPLAYYVEQIRLEYNRVAGPDEAAA